MTSATNTLTEWWRAFATAKGALARVYTTFSGMPLGYSESQMDMILRRQDLPLAKTYLAIMCEVTDANPDNYRDADLDTMNDLAFDLADIEGI